MAALTFPTAGDLRVVGFERLPNERGGQNRRTLSGQLRGDPLWEARAWTVEVIADTDAEAGNIYADADPFADLAITGDLTGAITARVEITGDGYTPVEDEWFRTLTLSIREQVA